MVVTMALVVAYLHFLGLGLLFATLVQEHRLLKPGIDAATRMQLAGIDLWYGVGAGLMLFTGLGRLWLEKSTAYYLQNGLFHAKVGLFLLMGLLSILPTVRFLQWRNQLRGGDDTPPEASQVRTLQWLVRVQLLLLLVMPLLGVMLARGVGARGA